MKIGDKVTLNPEFYTTKEIELYGGIHGEIVKIHKEDHFSIEVKLPNMRQRFSKKAITVTGRKIGLLEKLYGKLKELITR